MHGATIWATAPPRHDASLHAAHSFRGTESGCCPYRTAAFVLMPPNGLWNASTPPSSATKNVEFTPGAAVLCGSYMSTSRINSEPSTSGVCCRFSRASIRGWTSIGCRVCQRARRHGSAQEGGSRLPSAASDLGWGRLGRREPGHPRAALRCGCSTALIVCHVRQSIHSDVRRRRTGTRTVGPPLPPETLGFRTIERQAAEPDYPPSTCCVRVVRLGCSWSDLNSQMIRGQGRASLWSADQWLGLRWRKTGGKR